MRKRNVHGKVVAANGMPPVSEITADFEAATDDLSAAIALAFPRGIPPSEGDLLRVWPPDDEYPDDEAEGIQQILEGQPWDEVNIRLIIHHAANGLFNLTDTARLYYLPLWMKASLYDYDRGERLAELGPVSDRTLAELTPPPAGFLWRDMERFRQHFSALSDSQRAVVARFVSFMLLNRVFDPDFDGRLAALKEYWVHGQ